MLTFIAPIVNLNGSSPERLVEDLKTAISALVEARVFVQRCAPHGRDFQTAKDGEMLLALATAQHMKRISMIESVEGALMNIAEAILEQGR